MKTVASTQFIRPLSTLVWFDVVALYSVLFILGTSAYWQHLTHFTGFVLTNGFSGGWESTAVFQAALSASGFSPGLYIGWALLRDSLALVVFLAVGVVIFWRRGHEWIGWYTSLMLILFGMVFSSNIGAPDYQVYRYRRVSTPLQRQQTKWPLWSVAIMIISILLGVVIIPVLFPVVRTADPIRLVYDWGLTVMTSSATLLLPLGLGFAILRYRLWDIDLIIRKTLIYAVLSGLLALVYFGLVVLLQSVFNSVSGQQSAVAIVITTLIIAALFAPLRRRIQDVIDRRFYRQKYNAQQVLAQFAQTCLDETDMDRLTAELVRVVQETMQPEHVSLWLKPEKKRARDV